MIEYQWSRFSGFDRSVLDVGEEYHDKFYQKCLKGDCYHPGYFKHVVLPKVEKAQKQKNSPEFISENSRPAVSQPLKLFRDVIALFLQCMSCVLGLRLGHIPKQDTDWSEL